MQMQRFGRQLERKLTDRIFKLRNKGSIFSAQGDSIWLMHPEQKVLQQELIGNKAQNSREFGRILIDSIYFPML